MGKSQKKKKAAADFKKVKLKVGKKLKRTRDTSTELKSKRLLIATQLAEPPTSAAKDRIPDLRAGKAEVVRDALKDLQRRSGDESWLRSEAWRLFPALGSLLSHDDAAVRKAAVGLAASLMESLSEERLSPYLPVLQAQLSVALTHLRPAIAFSALPLLSAMLSAAAEASKASQPLREALTGLLRSVGGRQRSLLPLAKRLPLLPPLRDFLRLHASQELKPRSANISPFYFPLDAPEEDVLPQHLAEIAGAAATFLTEIWMELGRAAEDGTEDLSAKDSAEASLTVLQAISSLLLLTTLHHHCPTLNAALRKALSSKAFRKTLTDSERVSKALLKPSNLLLRQLSEFL